MNNTHCPTRSQFFRAALAFSLSFGLLPASHASAASAQETDSQRYDEGKRLLEQGRYEEAAATFEQVASSEPVRVAALPKEPKPSKQPASQNQTPVVSASGFMRPRLAKWHAGQAQSSFDKNEYLAAVTHAQRAVDLDAADKASRMLIEKAKKALKEQQISAQKSGALIKQANHAEAKRNWKDASALWKKVLKLDPGNKPAKEGALRAQLEMDKLYPPIKDISELASVPLAAGTEDQEYRIAIGDVLEVFVWQQPDLSRDVVVRPDGRLSFPLVGDISAVSQTLMDVDNALTERLRTYVKYPDVSLAIKRFGGTKTILMGEVQRPGIYVPTGEGRVLDVIAMAGGFMDKADKENVLLIRGGLESPQLAKLDINSIMTRGALQDNVILQPNDILYVGKQGKSAWRSLRDIFDEISPVMSEYLIFQTVATNHGAREFQRTGRDIGVD